MQPILFIGTFLVLLALRTFPWAFNFVGMRGKRLPPGMAVFHSRGFGSPF